MQRLKDGEQCVYDLTDASRPGNRVYPSILQVLKQVIVSNCVINQSSDTDRVLTEAFKALKPCGRVAVPDVVIRGNVPAEIQTPVAATAVDNAILHNQCEEAQTFIVRRYASLMTDLRLGRGYYLNALLHMLRINSAYESDACLKIEELSMIYRDAEVFASQVVRFLLVHSFNVGDSRQSW